MQRVIFTLLVGFAVGLAFGCADEADREGRTPAQEDTSVRPDATEPAPPLRAETDAQPVEYDTVFAPRADCAEDCDGDGLDDCQEAELGTAQCVADSDRDGLTDKQEVDLGTDPLDPDTDSDGVDDGEEVDLELDPNRRSSFDDGKDDGMRWIVDACETTTTDDVRYFNNEPGNWTFGLSTAFDNYRELVLDREYAADAHAAAFYGDTSAQFAGSLISHPSRFDDPTDSVARTMTRVVDILELDELSFRGEITRFETHDGFDAASQTLIADPDSPISPQALREALTLRVLPPHVLPDVMPEISDTSTRLLRLNVTYVHRTLDQAFGQSLMNVSIVPEQVHAQSRRIRRQVVDATNTTNLALHDRGVRPGCARHPANELPKADFYWMLDQSRSMEDDFDAVIGFASRFFDILAASGMDYRLGVATMDRAALGSLTPDALWHTSKETFIGTLEEIQHDPYGADGQLHDDDEYGFEMARSGLSYMLGLDGEVPQPNVRIREEADVVTFFAADEEPEVLQQYPLGTSAGQRLLDDYASFFGRYSTVYALTTTDTPGYRQLAVDTGGAYAPIHGAPSETTQSIETFIARTLADASTYRLTDTPVTASIRVFKNGRWVPRSLENGYAYFPRSNSIVFFGSFRPEPHADGGPGDFVAVHYETFTNPPKP
ncbi:MAG: hypothetical protein ACQEVA_19255 [Myxococcota bacterium]